MADIRKGCFCKSTAGHDKDSYYIIVETEKGIAVADGKVRPYTKSRVCMDYEV